MRRNDKRLGELLLEVGWIQPEQLSQALRAQEVLGGRIGSCLLEGDAIDEDQLLRALSHQLGVRSARIKDLKNVPPEVYRLIPRELAIEHSAVPFRVLGNELSIALLDVHSRRRYEELAAAAGKGVCVFVGNEARVLAALEAYYELPMSERFRQLHSRLDVQAHQRRASGSNEPTYEQLIPAPKRAPGQTTPEPAPGDAAAAREQTAGVAAGAGLDEDTAPSEGADREDIAAALVARLARSSRRVLLFQIQKNQARAWTHAGGGIDDRLFQQLSIQLAEPSVFFSLRAGSRYYRGPLSPMPSHRRLAACWGGELFEDCLVLPIRVQRRLVGAALVDPGPDGFAEAAIGELEKASADAGRAFEDYILRAKRAVRPLSN